MLGGRARKLTLPASPALPNNTHVRGGRTVHYLATVSAALLLLVGCPWAAWTQETRLNDPLLDAMTGRWVLQGEITGKPTTHDVDITWALNHRFLRLHERSREMTWVGEPQYEADVFIGWDS